MNATQPSTMPAFMAALNRNGVRSPPPQAMTSGSEENSVTATSI